MDRQSLTSKKTNRSHRVAYCKLCMHKTTINNLPRHFANQHHGEIVRERGEHEEPELSNFIPDSHKFNSQYQPPPSARSYRHIKQKIAMQDPVQDQNVGQSLDSHERRPTDLEQFLKPNLPKRQRQAQTVIGKDDNINAEDFLFDFDELVQQTNDDKVKKLLMSGKEGYEMLPELLDKAEKFTQAEVIELVKTKPDRLKKALEQLEPEPSTTPKQLCGIVLTLLLFGEDMLKLIPRFTKGMTVQIRGEFNQLMDQHIKKIYLSNDVGRWIANHLDYMTVEIFKLALALDASQHNQAYMILQSARVCILPPEKQQQQSFIEFCERLIKHRRMQWLEKSLLNYPEQQLISYNDFLKTVMKLGYLRLHDLLESKKSSFEKSKVHQWLDLIQGYEDEDYNQDHMNTTQDQVLDQLMNKYSVPQDFMKTLTTSKASFLFEGVNYPPSQMQQAISIFIIAQLKKCKKLMFQLSAGSGKSRIAACASVVALRYCIGIKKVHIVIPNSSLKCRDSTEFADYFQNMTDQVQYHEALDFSRTQEDLVLIDESDTLIYKQPAVFKHCIDLGPSICLSATPSVKSECPIEKEVLKAMGLHHFNYQFKNQLDTSQLDFTHRLDQMESDVFINFLQEKRKKTPVLLYTTVQMIEALRQAQVKVIEVDEKFTDHKRLKELDEKDGQDFPLVVTSKDWAMRGLDYRAKENGIHLVVDQSFETQRDCDQGLARVGRFEDRCERFITYGTHQVDNISNRQAKKSMSDFILLREEQLNVKLSSTKKRLDEKQTNKINTRGHQFIAAAAKQDVSNTPKNKTE